MQRLSDRTAHQARPQRINGYRSTDRQGVQWHQRSHPKTAALPPHHHQHNTGCDLGGDRGVWPLFGLLKPFPADSWLGCCWTVSDVAGHLVATRCRRPTRCRLVRQRSSVPVHVRLQTFRRSPSFVIPSLRGTVRGDLTPTTRCLECFRSRQGRGFERCVRCLEGGRWHCYLGGASSGGWGSRPPERDCRYRCSATPRLLVSRE